MNSHYKYMSEGGNIQTYLRLDSGAVFKWRKDNA